MAVSNNSVSEKSSVAAPSNLNHYNPTPAIRPRRHRFTTLLERCCRQAYTRAQNIHHSLLDTISARCLASRSISSCPMDDSMELNRRKCVRSHRVYSQDQVQVRYPKRAGQRKMQLGCFHEDEDEDGNADELWEQGMGPYAYVAGDGAFYLKSAERKDSGICCWKPVPCGLPRM